MENILPEKPQVIDPLKKDTKNKKIIIGILFLLFLILLAFLFWVWKNNYKYSGTVSAYQLELPQELTNVNLQNPTKNDRLVIENNLSSVITAKTGVKREDIPKKPVYVVLTQNNQPIIPDSAGSIIQNTQTPTQASQTTPTPTPTPTSPVTPTPSLGSCTDSDGGFVIYTKGTVTQPGHFLSPFTDYCTEIDGVSFDKAYLIEYTCEENYWKMNTYDCPGGCKDGACQEAEAPTPIPETCSDTDGGDKPNQYGEVTWRSQVSKDHCFSVQNGEQFESCSGAQPFCRLAENYCNQVNVAVVRTYECANGCSQGACVGQSPTLPPAQPAYQCTDSDGGYNYVVKGTLIDKANHPHEDSCLGTQRLTEFACLQTADNSGVYNPVNEYYKLNYDCPYRCENGICISPPITSTPTPTLIPASVSPTLMPLVDSASCYDSDGGKNYSVKGQTRPAEGFTVISPVPTVSTEKYTYNADQEQADSGSSGRSTEKYDYTEGNEQEGTNDTQSNSTEKYTYNVDQPSDNSVSDSCISNITLKEYFCHFDGKQVEQIEVNCEGECRDGACVSADVPSESRSRAGFSVSGQAEDEYQNVYKSNLMHDINKIYIEARQKYPNLQMKNINLVLSDFGLDLPNYFNISTNEIVLQKGNLPSQEDLTWLVMVSLQKDLASLPIDKLNQEINKIPNKEVSRKAFPSDKGKEVPTSKPSKDNLKLTSIPKSEPVISLPSDLTCSKDWIEYTNPKFGLKFKYPKGWTEDAPGHYTIENDTLVRRALISTEKPEEQLDPKNKISRFDVIASTDDLKTTEYGQWLEDGSGLQKKSSVEFKGIPSEKYVLDIESAGGLLHKEDYYFKKGNIYYLLVLNISVDPDLKAQNESILKCFLDSFSL